MKQIGGRFVWRTTCRLRPDDRGTAVVAYGAYLLSLLFFALVIVSELLGGGTDRRSELFPLLLILTLLATASGLMGRELFWSQPTLLTAAWP